MIKKLLFLFVLISSIQAFSQAQAYQAPNLMSCSTVFNLTQQNAIILGNQLPANFTVSYYHSLADATSNTNPIVNTLSYSGTNGEMIYAAVVSLSDATIATTSFSLIAGSSPVAPQMADVVACDSYVLPALPAGFIYSFTPGGTAPISIGMVLTVTTTVYIFGGSGSCTDESSFMVTIVATPATPVLSDVTACNSYTLPELPPYNNYFSGPNGSGTLIPAGTVIQSTTTLYVYAQIMLCNSEASFTITISNTQNPIDDVIACNSYVLPPLPSGGSYSFNGVPLVGTEPFVISQTGQVALDIPGLCQEFFMVQIVNLDPGAIMPLQECDDNGDGIATFDLGALGGSLAGQYPNAVIEFYETMADAENQQNAITEALYINIMPFSQTIFMRISSTIIDCYTVSQITLQTTACGTISGTVLVDLDGNGCSASDGPLSNLEVARTTGNTTAYAYTNVSGEYEFNNVPYGWSTISIVQPVGGYNLNPMDASIEVLSSSGYTADFCATPPPPVNDVSVYIYPMMNARPGFPLQYAMVVSNVGTTTMSGSVTFTFDDQYVDFVNSSPVGNLTGNVLTFSYSDLSPSNYVLYNINFTVSQPGITDLGDILNFSAMAATDLPDANISNNNSSYVQTVVNSYDPNDITCHEGAVISESQANDYLHYTIRFQNTGTADAVNVRLENELDPLLDWSTFQPIASSHTYNAQRRDNNVTFTFNNIMLPGSTVDEPGSHGFVTYRIKPLPGLQIGEVISNTADIFFDFNSPITTNTATTQIQQLSVHKNDLSSLKIYPNPASAIVNVHVESADVITLSVADLQGKVILSQRKMLINNEVSVDVSGIQSGMYFVRISAGDSNVVRKLIIR